MRNLSRLLYLSTALPDMDEESVQRILDVSRKRNAENDVTGVLVMGGGNFIQVLEGEEKKLVRLYAKIIDDPRHLDCTLIGIAPVETRMFQQWFMGYVKKPAEAIDEGRRQFLDYRTRHGQGEELLRAMKRFVAMLKED